MKTKKNMWMKITMVLLGLGLLAVIGLTVSAAWFQDKDEASTATELGHAVTVRLKDLDSTEEVQGWKEIYNSERTKAYPGDTLVGATRVEMGSTTPALIRVRVITSVTTSGGTTYTGGDFGTITLTNFSGVTTPTKVSDTSVGAYYSKLIASKDETTYANSADNWNRFLLKNMTDELSLSATDWTGAIGTDGWRYYRHIYGDTEHKSQAIADKDKISKSIELFNKLILSPLLTDEVANWKISIDLEVEAIQAANREDPEHPWFNDLKDVDFTNDYDRGNEGGSSSSGDEGGSSVQQASPAGWFIVDEETGSTITGLQNEGLTAQSIVIPSEINGTAITSIGDEAFNPGVSSSLEANGTLKSVVIPDSVETIGAYAFALCTSLESVEFNATTSSVSTMSANGQSGVRMSTRSSTSTGLKTIGAYAFGACTALTSIVIPEGVETIGEYAFTECLALESIVIPESLTTIGEDAFCDCEVLSTLYFMSTGDTFLDFMGNEDLDFDESFVTLFETALGNGTCYLYSETETDGCYIAEAGMSFECWHFVNGKPTVWGEVADDDIDLSDPEGYPTEASPEAWFEFDSSTGTITGLTDDGKAATDIVIPKTIGGVAVTAIGESAFDDNKCHNLIIPNCVTNIAQLAFVGDRGGLESIVVPKTLKKAFYLIYANKLKYIYSYNNKPLVGYNNDCMTICYYSEEQPTTSGDFWHYVGGTPTIWETDIYRVSEDGKLSVSAYGKNVLSGEVEIQKTYNGVSVTGIDKLGFAFCKNVTSITIPAWLTSIGENAFYGCSGLTEINYNATNCTVSQDSTMGGPFAGAGSKDCVVRIGDGVTKIPSYMFSGNGDLAMWFRCSQVIFPEGLLEIEDKVFWYVNGLTSITIPSSVTSVGSLVFNGNDLISIIIPKSVTSIGGGSFSGNSLTDIYYEGTQDEWNAIEGVDSLYISSDVTIHYNSTGV